MSNSKMETAEPVLRKLRRVGISFVTASLVHLLILLVPPERPPASELLEIWLYSHIGPLAFLPYSWATGLLTFVICVGLILPTVLKRNDWFISLSAGGFLLWLLVGFGAIVQSI